MKISLIKHLLKEDDGWGLDTVNYEIVKIIPCCDEIMKCKEIDLVYKDYLMYENAAYIRRQMIESKFSFCACNDDKVLGLTLIKDYYSYDDDECNVIDQNNTLIRFCPFCGAQHEIEVVLTLNSIELLEFYNMRIKELKAKKEATDSRAEASSLNKEIKDLYDIISDYYAPATLDIFRKEER